MNKAVIIAIVSAVVKKHLEKNPSIRGLKGRDGKSFSFESHRDDISAIVFNFISSIKSDLKLNFSDLTTKEINSIKLKFSDLTGEEKVSLKGLRGQKGLPGKKSRHGKDGKDFEFNEHKEDIEEIIKIHSKQGEKGKAGRDGRHGKDGLNGKDFEFADHKEEIEKLVKTHSKQGEKGKSGHDGRHGKDGKDFEFNECKEEIEELVKTHSKQGEKGKTGQKGKDGLDGESFNFEGEKLKIATIIDFFLKEMESDLKLRFSDLTDEDKEEFKGDKGLRGRDGKDFIFKQHQEVIDEIIQTHIDEKNEDIYNFTVKIFDENKDLLKLKFSDLTDEEKKEIKGGKGPRGQKGKDGVRGLSTYEVWLCENNQGDELSFLKSLVGAQGRIGIQGLPGLRGLSGINGLHGENGREGRDAPVIIKVDVKTFAKDKFYLRFHFSDLTFIDTNKVKFPQIVNIIQQSMFSYNKSDNRFITTQYDRMGVELPYGFKILTDSCGNMLGRG